MNDVAIYTPDAAPLYEQQQGVTGGAERQTALLAAGLARRGLSVAHIVLPLEAPRDPPEPTLSVLQRAPLATHRRFLGHPLELTRIWRALETADAETYVFRTGVAALGATALFCRIRGRGLIFSAASNLDFTFAFYEGKRPQLRAYKFGVRRADAVVVQSDEQLALAEHAFPDLRRVVEIPSFAEPAAPSAHSPEAFLWTGRLDHFKQPLRYVRLAEELPEARFWMIPKFVHEDPPLAGEVRERAARLPNLELLEARPHAELMRLIERSVAIVNTGAAEGMPNLFLEAWTRGVPVASFEFDPDGRIGSGGLGVAADGTWARFREGAGDLWRRRGDRSELSERVRTYVASVHGLEAVTERWVDVIADVTGAQLEASVPA